MAAITIRQKFVTTALATTVVLLAMACAYVVANHELHAPMYHHYRPDLDYRASGFFDELRSHLPPKLQDAMGLKPFVWKYLPCRVELCIYDLALTKSGWAHEDYLRSVGRDVSEICYSEYKRLTDKLDWIHGNGYWIEFMNLCQDLRASHTRSLIAMHLPREIAEDCSDAIAGGWVVGDNGRFYHPDLPSSSYDGTTRPPGSFAVECMPLTPDRPYMGNIGSGNEPRVYLGHSHALELEHPERYWTPEPVPVD